MKRHLLPLSIMLSCASYSTYAEDDNSFQHSITFAQSYSFDFESTGYGAEYEIKPWHDLGLTFLAGFQYARELQYQNQGANWNHHLTTMSYGLGYQWQASDTFSISVKAGGSTSLSDQTDSSILMGDTSGFVNFEMAYRVFNGFEVVNRFGHDFGHDNLPGYSSFGLGLRYWFGSHSDDGTFDESDVSELDARQESAIQELSQETQFGDVVPEQPVMQDDLIEQDNGIEVLNSQETLTNDDLVERNVIVTTPEPEEFKPFFSVQIGSFSKLASMNAFLRAKKIDESDIITRNASGMKKISMGKFDNKITANRFATELKSRGINGFVTWISKKPDSM